jgi:hypothetical protein
MAAPNGGLIQRDHTYVLGPNQDARLASVAAGGAIQGLTLQLDSDASFVLRGRSMRVKYDGSRTQTPLNHLLARWAGPDRTYRSQDYIRQSLLSPYFGQLGNPIPVWPNIVYPRNGVITVDVKNDGALALTNLTFYWRGVKLFSQGAVKAATYPATFGPLPYTYPQLVKSLAVTSAPIRQSFLAANGKPISDADFVIRGMQAGLPFSSTPVNEVFIKLLDEDEKPYSNDAVHVDVFCGNSCFGVTYPSAGGSVAPIGGGPGAPGMLFPELYIQKNHIMYYEISRSDASYGEAQVCDFPLAFIGQKVFAK